MKSVSLFFLIEEALRPPSWLKYQNPVNKPELPDGVSGQKQYDRPQYFVIPIKHGGWSMPLKKSYFALQLSKGCSVFGLDLALHSDIGGYEFKFFSELIRDKIK
ncbi:hypothetical protein Hanom_Chr03g00255511 [Helianthus anomalus]